jgi:hypothetical protein
MKMHALPTAGRRRVRMTRPRRPAVDIACAGSWRPSNGDRFSCTLVGAGGVRPGRSPTRASMGTAPRVSAVPAHDRQRGDRPGWRGQRIGARRASRMRHAGISQTAPTQPATTPAARPPLSRQGLAPISTKLCCIFSLSATFAEQQISQQEEGPPLTALDPPSREAGYATLRYPCLLGCAVRAGLGRRGHGRRARLSPV